AGLSLAGLVHQALVDSTIAIEESPAEPSRLSITFPVVAESTSAGGTTLTMDVVRVGGGRLRLERVALKRNGRMWHEIAATAWQQVSVFEHWDLPSELTLSQQLPRTRGTDGGVDFFGGSSLESDYVLRWSAAVEICGADICFLGQEQPILALSDRRRLVRRDKLAQLVNEGAYGW